MKKKFLSVLLILSLLLGLPGMGFAGVADIKGYTQINPLGLNGEMKFTDLKTANGLWKNASIKVSEVQIDNVGYKKYSKVQGINYSDSFYSKVDALKVKVTYTFSGFSGNQNSLIKDNLLAKEIIVLKSNHIFTDGGQLYSKFPNALYNKVEKYSADGKVNKGDWYSKKIKDVNFSKPTTMTGYVYLVLDKGKEEGATIDFELYPQKDPNKSEVHFVLTNKALASKIKSGGSYIYGSDAVGIIKADFEMQEYTAQISQFENTDVVAKYYRIGKATDYVIDMAMIKSVELAMDANELDEYLADTVDQFAEKYEIEKYEENGVYSARGISEANNKYVSLHLVNKGDYFCMILVMSDVREIEKVDKLWESYKANNDLTSIPKTTSTDTLASFTYGTSSYGTITSPEKLYEVTVSDSTALQYVGKSNLCEYTLNYFENGNGYFAKLEKKYSAWIPKASNAKLDKGNILVYSDATDPSDCYTIILIAKGDKIYQLTMDLTQSKLATHKNPVIKSYLLSIGYTESEADGILADPIFK